MPKVLNKHKDVIPAGSVYIGRPSKWGNPFVIPRDGTREQVIEKYRELIKGNDVSELCGKNLVCFCAPKACHGDVLLEMANDGDNKSTG